MSKFNQRFKELKEESGLTLKKLSEEINISAPNLSYYMNNREPNYDILVTIAEYFHVTTDYLTGRSNQKDPKAEMVVDNIKNASEHITKNKNRIQDIDNGIENFYNTLVRIANIEVDNDSLDDIWASIKLWLDAMQKYCIYLETLPNDPYPIDVAKEVMDSLTHSVKIASERIINMLRDICINEEKQVPQEIKKRVVMRSSFGIRPQEDADDKKPE